MFTPDKTVIEYVPLVGEDGQSFLSFPGEVKTMEEAKLPLVATIANKPCFAHVEIGLEGGEVVGDNGAMLWIKAGTGAISINTWCHLGGCCAANFRECAGEGFWVNRYEGTGQVAFGFDLPGDMITMSCTTDQGWILSKGVFICGTSNLCVSGQFGGCCACMFSGEGGMLTHVTTVSQEPNVFFAGGFGNIQKQKVPDGRTLAVNTGMFFAAPDQVPINVGLPGGCWECCCSGEGFVMKFHGPCVVYTQNRDPAVFKKLLSPAYNQSQGGGGQGGGGGGS